MTTLYKYLGKGAIVHVPARDITEADVETFAETWLRNGIDEATLLASGLYAKPVVEQEPKKRSKRGATQDADKEGE